MSLNDKLNSLIEGKIDFEGQKTTDRWLRYSLVIATAVSFLLGFVLQSQKVTFSVLGVSTLGAALVLLPPWPIYNKNSVKWLPSKKNE
ncbi:hypothetical protein FRC02_009414 [Tulasnella sp. 418]|nr:hypothetical protein FRC02_009414 [Tulasnella sp. 418]